MIPGVNPRQMQQMMRKMGVNQQDLDIDEVIFKMKDKTLVFRNPSVSKVNMMGQETYQLVGEPVEVAIDTTPEISEEDIQMVVDQTACSKEDALKALEEYKGDLAEAIMSFKS